MSKDDDAWAFDRLVSVPGLEECASARVTIDGITHRALNEDSTGWRTLCRSHRLAVFAGGVSVWVSIDSPTRSCVWSSTDVDCLCCIPAGG